VVLLKKQTAAPQMCYTSAPQRSWHTAQMHVRNTIRSASYKHRSAALGGLGQDSERRSSRKGNSRFPVSEEVHRRSPVNSVPHLLRSLLQGSRPHPAQTTCFQSPVSYTTLVHLNVSVHPLECSTRSGSSPCHHHLP
jgi:hypothetical protein